MIADGMKMVKGEWHYYLGGNEVSQKEYEKQYPPTKFRAGDTFACPNDQSWPMVSKLALACNPSQVQKMNERNEREGLTGVHYRPDGTCEISCESAYKRLRRYEDYRHRDSYCE